MIVKFSPSPGSEGALLSCTKHKQNNKKKTKSNKKYKDIVPKPEPSASLDKRTHSFLFRKPMTSFFFSVFFFLVFSLDISLKTVRQTRTLDLELLFVSGYFTE